MKGYKPLPSAERLRELLDFDSATGVLTWKVLRPGSGKVGSVAGTRKRRGHLEVRIDGVKFQTHRIIWKLKTGEDPPEQIDHRDCNPGNNRLSNLRKATPGQNQANRPALRRSVSGIKGVSPRYRGRKGQAGRAIRAWRAQIKYRGRVIFLGDFKKPEIARQAYDTRAFLLQGPFARLNGWGIVSDTGCELLPARP